MPVEPPPPRPAFQVVGGRKDRVVVHEDDVACEPAPFPGRTVALGGLLAQAFALPVLSFMGWFLASLVHEMGHAAMGWLCGMPSFPAIRLDGHAAAVHSEQSTGLVFFVAAGLGWLAWSRREHRLQAAALGALAVGAPLIAFAGPLRELAFLVMGHGGELIFAGLAFLRAADVDEREAVERTLYATLAWYLLSKNLTLFFGLITSAEVMIEYYGSGSFGLTNDLIRAAEDVLDCSVQAVATGMLAASLSVVPVALGVRWWNRREAASGP
ncbi:MAG: hypothetical protein ACF8XB_01860 [Planctomycetota bacterium JB042]